MANTGTELLQFASFTFSDADDSAFTTNKNAIARVNQATFNDNFGIVDVDDFDQAAGIILDRLLTSRSVDVSFGINVVVSDTGVQQVHTKYKAATYSYLEIVAADTETTPTTLTLQVGGYYSNFTIDFAKPIATVQMAFSASEVLSHDIS